MDFVGGMRENWSPLEGSGQVVALEVLRHGPIARVDLAKRLGLSTGSLTRLTKPLIDSGLLAEGKAQPVPLGRPTLPLDVNVQSAYFVGIKLVSDSAYFVVTDLRANMVAKRFIELPNSTPDAVVETLTHVISELQAEQPRIVAVGVSLGGIVRDREFVEFARYLRWRDVPFARLLETAVKLPVVVENDVRSLTQSEHWFGVGRGLESFALVTIGVGIGCGLVVGGELQPHPAGNITHLTVAGDTEDTCKYGHRGCADVMLTSGQILKRARDAAGRPELTYDEMLDSDFEAPEVLAAAAQHLGVLVAHVTNLINPEKVILLGEGVGFATLFAESLRQGARFARIPGQPEVVFDIPPFEFYEWARGGAVVAVQSYVLGHFGSARVANESTLTDQPA